MKHSRKVIGQAGYEIAVPTSVAEAIARGGEQVGAVAQHTPFMPALERASR